MNQAAVEVHDLSVNFGDFRAVKQLSFTVRRGEIFGFLGANGAGKTTTIRVLCGLLRPSAGAVRIAGLGFAQGERAIKAKVGYMSQKFTLYNDLTVAENLDFAASLRKLPRHQYRAQREQLFALIAFARPLTTLVGQLPSGIKQQVSLAAALLHDPEIVFLDEPTAGVSPAARARFWALIRQIAAIGKTVFVTTHYMDEAENCERIALLREGELIALDTPAGLKRAAFPQGLLECEAKGTLSYTEISALSNHPAFSFFEPYGLTFHAALAPGISAAQLESEFGEKFHLRAIPPSLEDVFIARVEGKA